MLQPRVSPISLSIVLSLLLLYLLFTRRRLLTHYAPNLSSHFSYKVISSSSASYFGDINNSTLGFQKVFAIGLPERSDKRDALALISSLTEFKIDWIEGVRGESVVDKALPFGVDRVKLWESNLGSWRGHLNAVRTIVDEGITTALIIEDDMDWDVRLKYQLQEIAHGTQALQSSFPQSANKTFNSPYGQNWDLLWLGHCGEIFPETLEENNPSSLTAPELRTLSRKYTIHPDPTMPPPHKTVGFQNFTADPYTRWVHVSGGPICTFGYALSLHGAKKVLYDLSVDHLVGPFDNALAGLCRWGRSSDRLGMRCLSVTPGVFTHHKAKGWVMGDSDIQIVGGGEKGTLREVGTTENVVWSARLNVKELLRGGEMSSQFANE